MSYSQKYTIVQFLEPIEPQQTFSMEEWPLHITLADVFAINFDESFIKELASHLSSKECISTESMEEAQLGDHNNPTKVTLIKNTSELQSLHDELINFLQAHDAVFNSPQFTHEGFLPHSTHQRHAHLETGKKINISELSLVDMFVNNNWKLRKVLENYKLKS